MNRDEKMAQKLHYCWLIFFLMLVGCSQNQQRAVEILNLELSGRLEVDFPIKDLDYNTSTKTLYLAENYKDYIWVYSDFDFLNKFGGKGNHKNSFQLLTDIEVSDNGNILALDNLRKRIAIFDKNGIYKNEILLNKYSNPTKFTLSNDDLLYLYDNDEQEVVIINMLTAQEFIRLGKYEIESPQAIKINNNLLNVTTNKLQTDTYFGMGGFNQNYPFLTVIDNFQNTISLVDNFITINKIIKTQAVVQSPIMGMMIKYNTLIIYTQKEVLLYNIKYNLNQ